MAERTRAIHALVFLALFSSLEFYSFAARVSSTSPPDQLRREDSVSLLQVNEGAREGTEFAFVGTIIFIISVSVSLCAYLDKVLAAETENSAYRELLREQIGHLKSVLMNQEKVFESWKEWEDSKEQPLSKEEEDILTMTKFMVVDGRTLLEAIIGKLASHKNAGLTSKTGRNVKIALKVTDYQWKDLKKRVETWTSIFETTTAQLHQVSQRRIGKTLIDVAEKIKKAEERSKALLVFDTKILDIRHSDVVEGKRLTQDLVAGQESTREHLRRTHEHTMSDIEQLLVNVKRSFKEHATETASSQTTASKIFEGAMDGMLDSLMRKTVIPEMLLTDFDQDFLLTKDKLPPAGLREQYVVCTTWVTQMEPPPLTMLERLQQIINDNELDVHSAVEYRDDLRDIESGLANSYKVCFSSQSCSNFDKYFKKYSLSFCGFLDDENAMDDICSVVSSARTTLLQNLSADADDTERYGFCATLSTANHDSPRVERSESGEKEVSVDELARIQMKRKIYREAADLIGENGKLTRAVDESLNEVKDAGNTATNDRKTLKKLEAEQDTLSTKITTAASLIRSYKMDLKKCEEQISASNPGLEESACELSPVQAEFDDALKTVVHLRSQQKTVFDDMLALWYSVQPFMRFQEDEVFQTVVGTLAEACPKLSASERRDLIGFRLNDRTRKAGQMVEQILKTYHRKYSDMQMQKLAAEGRRTGAPVPVREDTYPGKWIHSRWTMKTPNFVGRNVPKKTFARAPTPRKEPEGDPVEDDKLRARRTTPAVIEESGENDWAPDSEPGIQMVTFNKNYSAEESSSGEQY